LNLREEEEEQEEEDEVEEEEMEGKSWKREEGEEQIL